jgi:hypothetical protein
MTDLGSPPRVGILAGLRVGDRGGQRWGCCFRASTKAVKTGVGKVRVARAGVFESRMAMRVGRLAISTQELPSPAPEYDDFRQWSRVSMECLTAL